jgi:hypothetical protein
MEKSDEAVRVKNKELTPILSGNHGGLPLPKQINIQPRTS